MSPTSKDHKTKEKNGASITRPRLSAAVGINIAACDIEIAACDIDIAVGDGSRAKKEARENSPPIRETLSGRRGQLCCRLDRLAWAPFAELVDDFPEVAGIFLSDLLGKIAARRTRL